jgi:membrane-bound lytic murein transglycosylase
MNMKYLAVCFCATFLLLTSCKEDNQQLAGENKKAAQKKEVIYKNISKSWDFYAAPINTTSEQSVASWTEFRQFLEELGQKPTKTIGAFQKKAAELSKKVVLLNNNIPYQFQQPQIKSRIGTLITKVRLLDLFIHLDAIPDKKVVVLISEINAELVSLQRQMDKITEKSKIPVEEGESDMLRMLDTTRAIPNTTLDPNLPRVE